MNRLFMYYCQDEIQENIGFLAVGKTMISTRTIIFLSNAVVNG